MTPENKKSKRMVGVFLLGCVLLNYPVLSLFNRTVLFFGIPVLYAYMFSVWACLIFLIFLVTRIRPRPAKTLPQAEGGDA
jgi:hypothetical protein